LTCCNEESTEVLGLQSGVGGNQRHPRLAHKAQRGTANQMSKHPMANNVNMYSMHFKYFQKSLLFKSAKRFSK